MRNNFILIFSGILSLIVLSIILYFSNNYKLYPVELNINGENLSMYKLILYGNNCYNISTNGYFLIYDSSYLLINLSINGNYFNIPFHKSFINTTYFIFCNESFQINKTIEICPIFCPMICTTSGCTKCKCYNYTYYINITSPIIIVGNKILPYNNVYSSSNNIEEEELPYNYVYNLIKNII